MGWEPLQYSTTKANLFICFNNRKQSLDLFRDIFRGRRFRRDRMHRDRNLGTASWRDSGVGLWAAMPFSACGPHLGTGSGRGAYVAQGLQLPAAGLSGNSLVSPLIWFALSCPLCLSVPTQDLSAFRIPRTMTAVNRCSVVRPAQVYSRRSARFPPPPLPSGWSPPVRSDGKTQL